MDTTQYIFIGSVTALVFLAVLFRFENKHGRRLFLRGVRAGLDKLIRVSTEFVEQIVNYVGQGTMRKTSHILVHRLLHMLLGVVRGVEAGLKQVQQKNKQLVEGDAEHVGEKMSAMKEHADAIKMTPEEKRRKRQEMLK